MQKNRQIWTVKKLLDWSINYFLKKDIPQPKISAELLLSSVLKYNRMQLYLNFDKNVNEDELTLFKNYILKRLDHTPVQYILGEAYFRNIKLHVDENVLVPRPETELLVDNALLFAAESILTGKPADLKKGWTNINILEIGTGSGAIAISIAHEIESFLAGRTGGPDLPISEDEVTGISDNEDTGASKDKYCSIMDKKIPAGNLAGNPGKYPGKKINWKIVATEYSKKALDVAAANAMKILDAQKILNVEFINADIIPYNEDSFISKYKNNIDIVISNPPYISQKDYDSLPAEVRLYEPKEALLAGESGLETYEKILAVIFPFLNPDSCTIMFETDPKIAKQLKKLIISHASKNMVPVCDIKIENDYNSRERILIARFCGIK